MAATLTAEAIDKMNLPELRKHAAEQFEPSRSKGLKKAELQDLLKSNIVSSDDDELDDDELDDEIEPELDDDELDDIEPEVQSPVKAMAATKKTEAAAAPPEPAGDTLTAKQVATRIGTDAKTLRKFFRSPASTVEAVGQGGRYEFAKEDLPKIKSEFEKWNTTKPVRAPKGSAKTSAKPVPASAVNDEIDEDELELDDEEPTAEDLDEGDDLELELDDDEEED